ncbi:MAG: hypothetical protein K0S27_795 [Gammaproteobacteria bacterium]|jgi:hypothetical protein|nr:hypothetical protein [Gammaproteobacteria bacterium]
MADQKEEHYEEEGEYHFSDDQVNYDVEPEVSKTSSGGLTKESVLAKFSQYRRGILGGVSLIVLIGVVYKILIPASTAPSTEFNQTSAKPTKSIVTHTKTTVVSHSTSTPAALANKIQTVPAVENKIISSSVPAQPHPVPVATVAVMPPSATAQVNTAQVLPTVIAEQPKGLTNGGIQPVPSSPPMQKTLNPINTVQVSGIDAQIKDRITALEQQNTAMMNLLQTEYAQKVTDAETQANAIHGKMEELTKRVNRIETSLNQITQLLQGISKSQASNVMGNISTFSNGTTKSAEPRMIYNVQAIIPGRAWLKSETGDTVTVAEGDYLKRYGRVTKIDPYDGIVAIDTGNKIITLSYGISGD